MSSEPRRLHPAAALSVALRPLRDLLVPVVLGLVVSSSGGLDRLLGRGALVGLVVGAAAAVAGVVGWRRTTYAIEPTGLRVRRGILRVRETWLPFERVQAVDEVRGPLQRLFGIVELQVQAAGGGRAAEVVLEALSREAAAELRAALAAPHRADAAVSATVVAPPGRRLRRRDVLLAGATSGSVGVLLP